MANGIPIDLETFEALPIEKQNVAIAKMLIYMHSSGYECAEDREKRVTACQTRLTALENRKKVDMGIAGSTGIVGGALAILGKWLFGG